jgi:two-component system, response regulator PdtaR
MSGLQTRKSHIGTLPDRLVPDTVKAEAEVGLSIMKALRVLIVEDEVMIALFLAEVLSEMGHEVCASERTESGAIAAAARFQPDLIIADMRLQEGSGIAAVTAILRAGFIPHIIVSGDRLEKKYFDPAAVLLQKPFNEAQLIEAIRRAVELKNAIIV